MGEADEFLKDVLPRQRHADTAIHNGDPGPRKDLWSHSEPVTVLGAAKTVSGWSEVARLFDWLAGNFSKGAYEIDVIAAGVSGDLGYLIGHERTTASVSGGPPTAYELRVTLIFRREDGEWKEVHRHADAWPATEEALHDQLGRSGTPLRPLPEIAVGPEEADQYERRAERHHQHPLHFR